MKSTNKDDLTNQIMGDTCDSVPWSKYWGRVPLSHSDRCPRPKYCAVQWDLDTRRNGL